MANKNQVAVIETEKLSAFLGSELSVMKSDKAKRYPLYLRTKMGPMAFNTPAAQDFLLEHAIFKGAESPETVESSPEISPETSETSSGDSPENFPEAEESEVGKTEEKHGFMGKLLHMD